MIWDELIAAYLFLAGVGAGAFALGALVRLTKVDAPAASLAGCVLGPAAVMVGILLLVFDARAGLMNPLRFFGLVANLQSVMAWGVLILCAFVVASGLALLLTLMKRRVPAALDVIGIVLALCVAGYTGVLLGDAQVAFPLWSMVVLPPLFAVSAASTGFAAVALATQVTASDQARRLKAARKAGLVLPVVEAVLVAALLLVTSGTTGAAAAAAQATVSNLISGAFAPAFWVGLVAIGLLMPVALSLAEMRGASSPAASGAGAGATAEAPAGRAGALALAEKACVLVGGFMLRYLVVMAAIPVTFAG
ncbi:polysulfide reductase NrfD [Eggerthellaceae bacterium zg-1084]|uniref:NrfD/PsrC family molybdoenzyme membrane anchor subunit n=1 Tax=Berryella wangjianweii TaxID=2734634 RepID=UPI001554734B|nr:NrfD/PsrC family molybdoenzyme membrane anchor subunit [Berryella wangjianweii]NPD30832.1 polysulfide reductase NrfD [Berryella wangjianweii]NPD31699.1 polysulfide reductase NrfD [Eggerthellaceae bacterium zg-997]